ncbi:MAG: hypothetical protein HN392_08800 [Anaerolineae bacterium]|nr:hypothetical protein [Anaerolineae bacterium]
MTPEERVGQLFLISFNGAEILDESTLFEFLAEYPVGGVILKAENGNFSFAPETENNLYGLNTNLQKEFWDISQINATEEHRPDYIPLFIGISQEDVEMLGGLSPQPSQMAIGATWDTDLASDNGEVLGRELAALGINFYLGPSLDVLQHPDPNRSGDLGTYAFGGNSFWVGEMGKAFISGLHRGSEEKMLVIAKHFPGRGSADRSSEEEIATVRKSLEELEEVDLLPFSASTEALFASSNTDGLLTSHIRYQGLQGNISPTTRPLSLDEKTLTEIFALSPFKEWRIEGGITISDDLGSRAIREFYAPGGEDFFAHLVARDAFLSGNDLLYMGNILSTDSEDTYVSLSKSIDFFTQKYNEDAAFAARVDEALIRILTQKNSLYSSFSLSSVRPSAAELNELGQSPEASFNVAQNAATLISPDIKDLATVLPFPPALEERIIFITDTQFSAPCEACNQQTEINLSSTALSNAVFRLYGGENSEQVDENNISAYSFSDFLESLNSEEDTLFESSLRQADWVVISLASLENLSSLREFLAENQTLLREKKIILFSFTAPYALDSTDISKLTAYYGLYSYAPPFLDVAARLLFKELTPVGGAPVSISGMDYDLSIITQPAPEQLLTLNLDQPQEASLTPQADAATPAPTAIPMFEVGDTLAVRTGAILDHNDNLVPDGTLVTFSLTIGNESEIPQLIQTQTSGGIARADFQLNQTGLLDIRVASGEASLSEILRLDISDEGVAVAVTIIPPVVEETPTSAPTLSPMPTPTSSPYFSEGKLRFSAWFISFLLWIFGAWLSFLAGKQIENTRWGLRWALTTLLGGIIAYNYLVLGIFGADAIIENGIIGVIFFVVLGEFLGWLGGWIWMRRKIL